MNGNDIAEDNNNENIDFGDGVRRRVIAPKVAGREPTALGSDRARTCEPRPRK
jgi:hypothetical protein